MRFDQILVAVILMAFAGVLYFVLIPPGTLNQTLVDKTNSDSSAKR